MTEKLRIEIPLVLPDVTDEADRCISRLQDVLRARVGVEEAHVASEAGGPPMLCVHYDPSRLSLSQVRAAVDAAGADIASRFGHAVWDLGQTLNPREARRIETQAGRLPGVVEAAIGAAGIVRVEFDARQTNRETLSAALQRLGADVSEDEHAGHDHGPSKHDHGHAGLFGPVGPKLRFWPTRRTLWEHGVED